MKQKTVIFFCAIGSSLSVYMVLVIGSGILANFLNLNYPLGGSPVIILSILWGGPLAIFFVVPALVLSVKWKVSTPVKITIVALNALGVLCSIYSMWWVFMLWKIGRINPG